MKRTALVTGGTRGIGAAIAMALKAEGYQVVVNYGGNEQAANAFTDKTGIAAYKFDAGNFEKTQVAIKQIEGDFGPIEVLVNNAGITRDAALQKMKAEQWCEVIQTNLTSCFNTSRAVIEGMRKRGFGRIVNIGSVNGQTGQFGQTNYAAAKAGIQGFTKALALENAGKGITVNTVAPGHIETDMLRTVPEKVIPKIVAQIPIGRLGQPEDVARSVLFLAADEAGFITGTTLSVNGGQFMS